LNSIEEFQKALASLRADIKGSRKRQLIEKLNAAKRKRDSIG